MPNSNKSARLERAVGRCALLIYGLIGAALLVVLVDFGWSTFRRLQAADPTGELGTIASSPRTVTMLQSLAIAMIVSSIALLLAGVALALHGARSQAGLSRDDTDRD
jgi:hypothetical protein